ncbi:S-layer homology domain-containing protein [Sporosarcina sp. FSL K6-5500]|uniref:S-layer homology domain-containing protein n=1 Tax=Sporosarcina sp. FSL K6-5500 TaxID=2921558 RepID=UPI0030FBB270
MGEINCKFNTLKIFLTTILLISIGNSFLLSKATAEQAYFNDINEETVSLNSIKSEAEQEIIKGYPDGTFKPDIHIDESVKDVKTKQDSVSKVDIHQTKGKVQSLKPLERWVPLPASIRAHREDTDAPAGSVRNVAYQGGRYLIFEYDHKHKIIDLETNKVSAVLGSDLNPSMGGNMASWISTDSKKIVLYDLDTKKLKEIKCPNNDTCRTSNISKDGRYVTFLAQLQVGTKNAAGATVTQRYIYDVGKKNDSFIL